MKVKLLFFTFIVFQLAVSSPVHAQGFTVSYRGLDFAASPGEKILTSIGVTNLMNEPLTLRIYRGDWVRVEGETSKYVFDETGGKEPRTILPWMTFGPDHLVIAANEKREIYCEVTVPNDNSLQGSYWGVIFIEQAPTVTSVPVESETRFTGTRRKFM